MKYERLTYHSKLGLTNRRGTEQEVIDRLAELEDKIESGKLLELPCKVGDMVYVPYVHKGVSGIMKLPVDEIQIAKYSIVFCTDFETDDIDFGIRFSNGLFLLDTYQDIWFIDKSQAEARLKELQGE